MDIVEVKNICKTYQAFQMKDVSFSLEEGRITGFIGRNGAGKSTTIKAMLNLIHTDGGKIFYFGMPLAGNEAKIKQRIGYSTGAVSWFPRKTIKKIPRKAAKVISWLKRSATFSGCRTLLSENIVAPPTPSISPKALKKL